MGKVRLTREQSREQTRQRLLDAAQELFLSQGYSASSVEDIAAAAGYTRGAFYSNFSSKAEMFLELLRRDHEHMIGKMRVIFEAQPGRAQMEEQVLRFYSQHFRDNSCFLLWIEAKLQAARDPDFRVGFIAFMREQRAAITEYARQFSALAGTPLSMPPEHLALGLIALCDGVQFSYAFDPQAVSAEMAENVLAEFFRRVVFGGAAA
ncbi:TetR family transcriptional regulator [Bordetella hinzii]|nr:TetR family transcriptional regulator [Bordetella hinzii]QWF37169.1 TetR family transcriptional regulator [Bordetella hinzii]QWF41713.1 TetR family transcriptional regulator [Bordetella hinzii]QWF46254.1 TetR family transcriptional regulator [Bordetella hinzii]QWF50793.1 TetR family transcriptional regulator [Bordetella hinzii]QWF55330.1 TetR family transcriptional regulator [Bordetella hinzii]